MVDFEREIADFLDEQSQRIENLSAQEVKVQGFELINLLYKSILNSRIGKEDYLRSMMSHTTRSPSVLTLANEKHRHLAVYAAHPKQVGGGAIIFETGGIGTENASLDGLRGSLTASIRVIENGGTNKLVERASVRISDLPATFETAEISYYKGDTNLLLENTKTAVFKAGELFQRFSQI